MKKLIILSLIVITALSSFVAGIIYASQPSDIAQAIFNPKIKDYTLVYMQLVSFDGTMVYDTTTSAMVPLTTATYANTDITITIDSDFYIGQLKAITTLSNLKVVRRVMGSSDATPDKNDTQICVDAIYIDGNGTWLSWDGPESVIF